MLQSTSYSENKDLSPLYKSLKSLKQCPNYTGCTIFKKYSRLSFSNCYPFKGIKSPDGYFIEGLWNHILLYVHAHMVFEFLACFVQDKNKHKISAASLHTLANSNTCSVSRIKFYSGFPLLSLVDFLRCTIFTFQDHRWLLDITGQMPVFFRDQWYRTDTDAWKPMSDWQTNKDAGLTFFPVFAFQHLLITAEVSWFCTSLVRSARRTSMGCLTENPSCLKASQCNINRATLHHNEIAEPCWATSDPSELRCTLLSYAAP